MKIVYTLLMFLFVVWLLLFTYLRNPVIAFSGNVNTLVKEEVLKAHVIALSSITPSRSFDQPQSMYTAKQYITDSLNKMGYKIRLQEVYSEDNIYHNIIARYGDENATEVIVVGAHYDTASKDNPGADDNASGVAALLEIANLFAQNKNPTKVPIEFVAYTLEEPPSFGGKGMGSAYHAEELARNKVTVKFMMSLEMIGYYSNDWFSQDYPFSFFYLLYPWTGNFIALVSVPADRGLIQDFKKAMIPELNTTVYSVNAPATLPGIDFSDHRSYWAFDWPALMITDTAYLRNKNYHTPQDTADRLDYKKMSDVVGGIYKALVNLN
ncbi:MAG: M28 family peptidase [Bdellovibrionota bacterium]